MRHSLDMDRLWTKAGYTEIVLEHVYLAVPRGGNFWIKMGQSLDIDKLWTKGGYANLLNFGEYILLAIP